MCFLFWLGAAARSTKAGTGEARRWLLLLWRRKSIGGAGEGVHSVHIRSFTSQHSSSNFLKFILVGEPAPFFWSLRAPLITANFFKFFLVGEPAPSFLEPP